MFDIAELLGSGAPIGGVDPNAIVTPQMAAPSDLQASRGGGLLGLGGPRQLPDILGIKGGFRDALGTIGDSLLMAHGKDPIYGPEKKRAAVPEAMTDFATHPSEAIQRLAQVDAGMAREIAAKHAEEQAKNAETTSKTFGQNLENQANGLSLVSALLQGANETTYPNVRERALAIGKSMNMDYAPYLPATYDANAVQNAIRMGVKPNDLMDNDRQMLDTQSQIGRRDFQNSNDARRAAAYESSVASGNARRDFQNNNDAVRTGIDAANTGSQIKTRENPPPKPSSRPARGASNQAPSGRLPASRVPASARLGTLNGKRVAKVGDKIYYVD